MSGQATMSRWIWNAQRFGLTPAKVISNFRSSDGPRVVSNSLPKAGTHLLERALCLHPAVYRAPVRTLHARTIPRLGDLGELIARLRPHQLLVTHLEYTKERAAALDTSGVRSLFLIRDPRDIVVSQAHFIPRRESHAHHAVFAGVDDHQDILRLVIRGDATKGFPSVRQRLENYLGWLSSSSLLIRYEDLVGSSGGGDRERQLATLSSIFDHIGLPIDKTRLLKLSGKIFSDSSPTFRRGTTQQWRDQFDAGTVDLFEELVGDLADQYGYGFDETVHPTSGDSNASE